MKKYKIAVYAICKNEEKFVESWLNSMSEADYICVLDTGSTDNTFQLLKQNPKVILLQKTIFPWRFDTARNESLKLIPKDADFCCAIDLDERFEKGWREILEQNLTEDVKQVKYHYTWNFLPDGSEGVCFYADKIHKNGEFFWKYPVHEVITYSKKDDCKQITIPNLKLFHYADQTKSRGQYLPLLELAVKENPQNDRCLHYYARELFFHAEYKKAILQFKKHLNNPASTWEDERSSSQRYIGICYKMLGKKNLAKKHFLLAIIEKPTAREPYLELAKFLFENQKYNETIVTLNSMLNIFSQTKNYISNPECYNGFPYDLLSICYYKTNKKKQALANAYVALSFSPKDERILNNIKIFKEQ